MKIKNIFSTRNFLFLLLASTVGFTGCKKFLDVNENPNNPDSATPTLLLPTVEASLGQLMGNSFQVFGGIWAQYWTQSPVASQYRNFDRYSVTNTVFDRSWTTIYRNALINADLIIKSETPNSDNVKGIAYILKAYTFQAATDAFGDVPLADALDAAKSSSPKYDAQAAVYDSVFTYVDKGLALLKSTATTSLGEQDIVFQGNSAKWTAFGNTLKLRAYLRISGVDAQKAQSGIAALYATNPTFLNEDAQIKYSTTGGNQNPLYNESVGLGFVQNLGASATAVNGFLRNNDPRAFRFYTVIAPADTISYVLNGASNLSSNSGKTISSPSALVGGRANDPASATAPVKLISSAESAFLQAEAVARGWATGSVSTLFQNGIQASFTATSLTPAQAAAYIATAPDAQLGTSTATQIKAIITQKYFAMCGTQGFEAWTEYRRTGYPNFLITSVTSVLGAGRTPLRLLYPNSEAVSNGNYPGTVVLFQPVWWDVPTTVLPN